MAKKVASVALHAKKKVPVKTVGKSRKLEKVLKNVINYMKSDTYLFAPLLSSRSFNPVAHPDSFGGQICLEETEKKNLGESVDGYLKSNYYMYAATASPIKGQECGQKADINSIGKEKEPRVEEHNKEAMKRCGEIGNEEISNPSNRVVVKHSLRHRETVRHVVHQNHRAPGPAE